MHDLSFLIRGMRIMEIRHFSFYTSFLGRLYHLITRQSDFNSGPWPSAVAWVGSHCGSSFFIGGGGGPPNSIYKAEVWACAPWFALWAYIYVVFYPINNPPALD